MAFYWHSGPIRRETPVTADYRNTQNVRRFLKLQCGPEFRFDRSWAVRAGFSNRMDTQKDFFKMDASGQVARGMFNGGNGLIDVGIGQGQARVHLAR